MTKPNPHMFPGDTVYVQGDRPWEVFTLLRRTQQRGDGWHARCHSTGGTVILFDDDELVRVGEKKVPRLEAEFSVEEPEPGPEPGPEPCSRSWWADMKIERMDVPPEPACDGAIWTWRVPGSHSATLFTSKAAANRVRAALRLLDAVEGLELSDLLTQEP